MKKVLRIPPKVLPPLGGAVLLVLLMAYVGGCFDRGKIEPAEMAPPPGVPAPSQQGQAVAESHPVWYEAVGTFQSRVKASVAPQVTGRVLEVLADAGASIDQGTPLAVLDASEVTARLAGMRSALAAAQARQEQAESGFQRVQSLHEQGAATPEQMEAALAEKKQADAGVETASQRVREADVALGYTRIASPMSGIVASREVDPGDLAWPGKPIFVIHDPTDMRLEAHVREGLIGRVRAGDKVSIEITSMERSLEGVVDEVVPLADPVSRSVLVKVSIPETEGLYPGMFGKLRLKLGERPTVRVPAEAVTRIGQLSTVLVNDEGRWKRRYVTLGSLLDGRVEVLSGLAGGETIGWN